MLRKYLWVISMILCLSLNSKIFCEDSANCEVPKTSLVISIPKSGSYLLTKCLNLMLNRKIEFRADLINNKCPPFPQSLYEVPLPVFTEVIERSKNVIWLTHLMYKTEYAATLSANQVPFFFCYRDPRDLTISLAHYMKKYSNVWKKVINVPVGEIIMSIIKDGSLSNNHPPAQGIFDLYSKYLSWMSVPGCCPVRFESLVGVQGGGTEEMQLIEIKKIANHIGLPITEDLVNAISQTLFGGVVTFNDSQAIVGQGKAGQIGSWKYLFNEEHKQAFKETAGQLLIDLGYEKDLNW